MSISGNWINIYNSTMQLEQTDTGVIFGSYSSTTGSSGAYYIVGFGSQSATPGDGQSLALSILWRSYEGGQGDPSWHYVSGFSGQCITVDNVESLILLHDLVATAPFPGVVPGTGAYLDKLTYTPQTGGETPVPRPEPSGIEALNSPIDGTWSCVQDPSLSLTVALQDDVWGFVSGTLIWQGEQVPVAGFTDCYAVSGGLNLQGLTVTAYFPSTGQSIAFAGSLNLETGGLALAQLTSLGTAPSSLWTQTQLAGLDFVQG